MIKCKFCGAENPDGTRFCSSCGAKTEYIPVVEAVVDNTQTTQPKGPRKRNPIKAGILAWSIVNTVLGMVCCCTLFPFAAVILGVIAIIFTILAQDCQDEKDEKSKIKVAFVLNIIASATIVVSLLLLVGYMFMEGLQPYPYSQSYDLDSFLDMYPYLD